MSFDGYEIVSDYIDEQAYDMAVTLYGKNPTEEQLEECRECLIDRWM